MRKALLFLFIVLPIYLVINLYFLDKHYFLCPIEYKGDISIRCDLRGEGFFAASRRGNRLHEGIDLFAEIGSPVLAARSGRVIVSKENNKGMGSYVIIRHPGNIITIYGHLSKIYVIPNELIRQGQLIARVGKTGNANYPNIQPHLHFEVRKAGVPQDPLEYLQ